MDLRTLTRCVLSCGVLLAAGCGDPMLEDMTPPRPRPAHVAQPVTRTAPTQPAPTPPGHADIEGDLYLLYLVAAADGQAEAPRGPYMQTVQMEHADPARVAYLMAWLTDPAGSGGGAQRQFLVYADPAVQEWATRIASMLDVPADDDTAWAAAARALLKVAGPRFADRGVAKDLVEAFEPICQGRVDVQYRWLACMLAGRLQEEILARPLTAAEQFQQAAAISISTSPAWLIARHAQAKALLAGGDRTAARAVARGIVEQTGTRFARTRAYQDARGMAGQ